MASTATQNVIVYRVIFQDGLQTEHRVDLEESSVASATAEWTRLGFHQCPHCPLASTEAASCPFAAALQQPVELLARHASYEPVDVTVQWRDREIRQRTTLQRAAGSLLGAVGAASGCPHTRKLKAMAWFHLPFSNTDETLYRALGTYLLGQHLRAQRGLVADWGLDGLREMYRNLRQVNMGMACRLRAAAEEDSSLNGLILLDLLAADTLDTLNQYTGELDAFFGEFWKLDS